MAKDILRTYGIANYSVAIKLDNVEAVESAISLNLGIGFLPLLGVRKELRAGELAQVRVEHDQLECVLALVYREKKFSMSAMAEMIQFCRKSSLPKAGSSKTRASA
jgi:DNA-binding transcriptional LysR family regulator